MGVSMSQVLGQEVIEYFTVNDQNYDPVPDIDDSEFVCEIYEPQGVLSTSNRSIHHIGNGNYKISFTPNVIGNWYVTLRHPNYFPWGKCSEIFISKYGFDSIGEMVIRILGLSSENYAIDNAVYDANKNLTNSRVRIYSDSISVGTGMNVIGEYNMSAVYDSENKMIAYNMEKV